MKNKEYQFFFTASIGGFGVLTAKDKEEALEKIKNNDYDDIIDTYDMTIEEITDIVEIGEEEE